MIIPFRQIKSIVNSRVTSSGSPNDVYTTLNAASLQNDTDAVGDWTSPNGAEITFSSVSNGDGTFSMRVDENSIEAKLLRFYVYFETTETGQYQVTFWGSEHGSGVPRVRMAAVRGDGYGGTNITYSPTIEFTGTLAEHTFTFDDIYGTGCRAEFYFWYATTGDQYCIIDDITCVRIGDVP